MTSPADEAARTVTLTRRFRAPRPLVFRAWTLPEHIGQWWGPEGFSVTTFAMDVTPGGRWRYVMRGPDGAAYTNDVLYQEVAAPERLAYMHGDGTESFHVTVDFEAHGDETQVTMTMLFPTVEARNKAVEEVRAVEGGNETLGKLERFLRSEGGSP